MGILFAGNNSAEIWGGEYIEPGNSWFDDTDFVPGFMRVQMGPLFSTNLMSCQFPPSSSDVTWAHFFWGSTQQYTAGLGSDNLDGFTLVNAEGKILGGVNIDKIINSGSRISAFAFGNTRVKDSNIHIFTQGTPHQIDVRMEIDDSAKEITVEMYVNGGLIGTAASSYTGDRPSNPVFGIWHNNSLAIQNQFVYLREVIVTDDEDPRSWRLNQQLPSAQGHYDQWQGGYEELADVSRASRAVSGTAGQRTSMAYSGYSGPSAVGGVRAVVLGVYGAAGAYGGPASVEPFIRSGGTDYDLGEVQMSRNDSFYPVEIDINPATTMPWSTGEFDSIEIGLVSRA